MKLANNMSVGPALGLSVSMFVVPVLLLVAPSRADDWYWAGACGDGNWLTYCTFANDWCDPQHTVLWHHNNWGRTACGNPPAYPGPADSVYLAGNTIYLPGDASVNFLSLDGASQLGLRGTSGISTLSLTGPQLLNDGSVVINDTSSWSAALEFNVTATLDGGGEVALNSNRANAQLNTVGSGTLANAANHTIRGFGQINAALTNNGLVSADVAGQWLWLEGHDKNNNAVMQATGDGILALDQFQLTQSPLGQLLADNGSVYLQNGVTITGGVLGTATGGDIHSYEHNTLREVTIGQGGWLGVHGRSMTPTLTLAGSAITNNGSIVVNDNRAWSSVLHIADHLTLQGTGEIVLDSAGSGARLGTADGVVLTQAAGHTIRGTGQLNVAMANQGTIVGRTANR